MDEKISKNIVAIIVLFIGYYTFASFVFMYRNPLSNSMCMIRDISYIIRFEKVPYYQPMK